ncbi:MAG: DUF5011 domain-containing protein [Sedimentibacter sp.]|uniref:DUF5011 domain-containing protein n=1 Tax=Sedimentibacter sp. TaxID=1960295 RepID=UPI003159163D
MFNKTISFVLAVMMVAAAFIPFYAYAGTAVPAMDNVSMNKNIQYHYQDISYNFDDSSTPLPKKGIGPLYDDIFFTNADVYWTRKIDKTIGYVTPGERPTGSFGFCIDLKKSKLLGAVKKGDLYAECTVNARNYDLDGDFGKAVIIPYSNTGVYLTEYASAEHDLNNNWGDVKVTSPYIRSDAYYLVFSAYGERRGGAFNTNLNFDVHSIYGKIIDKTGPKVLSISDPATDNSGNQYIRQDINKNDPSIYVTMDEDCTFGVNNTVFLKNTAEREYITDLIYVGEISNNEGKVTYKFRINMTGGRSDHYTNVRLCTLSANDTMGNPLQQAYTDLNRIECSKRMDYQAPLNTYDSKINNLNDMKITDVFGLSSVTYSLTLKNTSISIIGNRWTVGDLENQPVSTAKKEVPMELSKITFTKTGIYDLTTTSADLAKNQINHGVSNLFFISDSDPIRATLNKNNAKFNLSSGDISPGTTDALTTMTLSLNSSVVPASMLTNAKVYYRWVSNRDDSLLSKFSDEKSSWKEVLFKTGSCETEALTIPVSYEDDGTAEYLKPMFEQGYLYVIPYVGDSISSPAYRTGSMALGGDVSTGIIQMLESNPVKGSFTDRGCSCTGQTPAGNTAEDHYRAVRNHTMDIGLDVNPEDNSNLSNIMWSISKTGVTNAVAASGTLGKSTSTNKYDIPISSVKGTSGSYTVTAALYSSFGDVTIKKMNLNIESPIIGIGSILYNQETQNLDFSVTYNSDSAELKDIIIEVCGRDITQFTEEIPSDMGSMYAATAVNTEEWGEAIFARTAFTQDPTNPKLMKSSFRASLTNMEKGGDSFVTLSGEKRVHLKYVTSNNVTVVNNNVATIKKSRIPPSITMSDAASSTNRYLTASDYNDASNPSIKVVAEEPIGVLSTLNYGWVDNANTSLVTTGGAIGGTSVSLGTDTGKIEFSPVIPEVAEKSSELYRMYYLSVYAENSFGKSSEKVFGPFYVLNENINDKRFLITVTDKVLAGNEALVAVDDRLYFIEELQKADRMRVTWQEAENDSNIVVKEYSLSFRRNAGKGYEPSNLSMVRVNYPELWDTGGKGGTYTLSKVEIYNSEDKGNIVKAQGPFGIVQTLRKYSLTINPVSSLHAFNVSSSQENTSIQYGWSDSNLDLPSSWTLSATGTSGIEISSGAKGNLLNSSSYLFVKAWNNYFRSGVCVHGFAPEEAIETQSITIGEENGAYLGPEIPIRIQTAQADKIVSLEVYDKFSATSMSAISVSKVYKISDSQVFGLVPALTTSGGAISCRVVVNGMDKGEYTAEFLDSSRSPLHYTVSNRTITLDNSVEPYDYQYYKMYDSFGRSFEFTGNSTEIFNSGTYVIVYKNADKLYAKSIDINNIVYTADDIHFSVVPETDEHNVTAYATATITMPYGSLIRDMYGVMTNVVANEGNVEATAHLSRNATYVFDVEFPDGSHTNYSIAIDCIHENIVPAMTVSTSPSAITYDPSGPLLTAGSVKANLNSMLEALNNCGLNEYMFVSNGRYSFAANENGALVEYVSVVDWIDKKCPEPTVTKYVWYDKDNDKQVDEGEKNIVIPSGYKTKQNIITEIIFPYGQQDSRPVKLIGSADFIADEDYVLESNPEFAYKYVFAYCPDGLQPVSVQNLMFEDTLGNRMSYTLTIDEIDRAALLTQLNYSTMDYTNRDVVVSMLANKAVQRFENVETIDADGNVAISEKQASPTYVFRENGTKDFNYREINLVEGGDEGCLTANVTWIDKSVPDVIVDYDAGLTNKPLKISFKVMDGSSEGASLKCGMVPIMLTSSGDDLDGSYIVSDNGRYIFTVSTKYGNTSTFIVPITNIDTFSPEISITGRSEVYIRKGEKYYDQGATAYDNRDKDITGAVKVQNSVNTAIASGSDYYEVVYTVTDKAGNTSSKTRKVHVIDISSAVVIIENNIVDLLGQNIYNVTVPDSGIIYMEFVGTEGSYTAKYQAGEKDSSGNCYDNAYFKQNGKYLSKSGTITVSEGIYTFHVQDQERNTRIFKINFIEK